MIREENYRRSLSDESVLVKAQHENNLILFDDTQPLKLGPNPLVNGTVALKANFIKSSALGGVLIHSIDLDDFTGNSCDLGRFPITNIVSQIFTTQSTSTILIPSIPEEKSRCENIRTRTLIADDDDCRYFFVCSGKSPIPEAHLPCPMNMHFSSKAKACQQEAFVSFFECQLIVRLNDFLALYVEFISNYE